MSLLQDLVPKFSGIGWASAFVKGKRQKGIIELCDLMLTTDGEYSSLLLADQILTLFDELSSEDKLEFYNHLTHNLDIDSKALRDAALRFYESSSAEDLKSLNEIVSSPRRRLLQLLNQVPDATHRLVQMRSDILRQLKTNPQILKLSNELLMLFGDWFNRGFLELKQINWQTPAHILEKIIEYEAVHAIGSWRDLRSRLEPKDRFCFAFFHPSMPEEPLVFVQVALTAEMPDNLNQVLGDETKEIHPDEANCAIFYSISNCHHGLAGVSFGNFLIKQVANSLQQEFPQLKTFATLSPVPLLSRWMQEQEILTEPEALNDETLEVLAAKYFLHEKDKYGFPYDPVARFHLRNGASLHRINLRADESDKGIEQSKGVMVNYVYDLNKVAENHEAYVGEKKVVHSAMVEKLASMSLDH